MTTRGIFILENIRSRQREGDWVPLGDVWLTPAAADNAYMGGGASTGPTSAMHKLTYATDGVSRIPGANILLRYGANAAPVSSASAGYFVAGMSGSESSPNSLNRRSYVKKLTYATETFSLTNSVINSPSSDGHGPKAQGGASTYTAGYTAAGSRDSGGGRTSMAQKIVFSSDTWSALPNLVNTTSGGVEWQGDAIGNSDGGYWCGGAGGHDYMSRVYKITYSSDTTSSSPSSDLPVTGRYFAGSGNANHGFLMGRRGGPSSIHSTVIKFTYATDTASAHPSNLPVNVQQSRGTGSLSDGYASGGCDNVPGSSYLSSIQKIQYSTGTTSTITDNMTRNGQRDVLAVSARDHGAPGLFPAKRFIDDASASPNYGYSVSGRNAPSPSQNSTAHKIDFSTDGNSAAPGVNNYISANMVFGAGSTTNGYIMGGTDFSPSDGESQVTKVTYSTETRTNLGSSHLGAHRYASYAMTHGNTALYVLGGRNPERSNCRKMTYSNDTFSDVPSDANLSASKYNGASMATSTAGYTIGGSTNGVSVISSVDKITFATETTARVPSADIPTPIARNKGLSESTAGYSVGGRDGPSNTSDSYSFLQKLTFASETGETISPTLTRNTNNMQTLGNDTRGYVVGGNRGPGSPAYQSAVDKFVYATSTASAVDNLTTGQAVGGGISPGSDNLPFFIEPTATPTASTTTLESISGVPNTGYFGAGDPGNNNSIKKFNFANETTSTIPATVSQPRELTAGTSSITYGYFSGGQSPKYTITDRVQYSNDTSSRIPGANTTTAIAGAMGSGSRSFGLLLGGEPSSGESSTVQKLTFASETFANDGTLSEGVKGAAVITNPQVKAYLCVGQVAAGDNRSEVEKYTFSTSTASSAPNSLRALKYQTGMGSLTAGYVTGGPLGGGAGESAVDKFTYSTDTWSTLSTAMSGGKYLAGGLNNTTVGVICGGIPSSGGTTTQRVTFSTDTVARIPGADWASNWYRINGAGARMNSAYESTPNVI